MNTKKMDFEELLSKLREVHPDLSPISAEDVVVANWVRLKCRYGCNALPCTFCATCIPEEKERIDPFDARNCRHKERVRPSMEACGIDVFGTLERAGYELSVLDSYSKGFALFGLVLLE
jgi:predicted metal-binding protein